MSLPVILADPTTVNESAPSAKLGQCFVFEHATYGRWVVRYVKFLNAVTYAAGQPVQFCDGPRTTVTNDISGGATATIGRAAGICLLVMTQNYHGYVLASGYYPTVLDNGDDDISLGDQIIIGASDGVCDSATTLTGKHLGFASADDSNADNTVAAVIDCTTE